MAAVLIHPEPRLAGPQSVSRRDGTWGLANTGAVRTSTPVTVSAELLDPTEPGSRPRGFLRSEAVMAGRFIVVAAAIVFAVWLAMRVQLVTVATFIAFVVSALLWPVVRRLRKVMPQAVAAILVVGVVTVVCLAFVWFIVVQMLAAVPTLVSAVVGSVEAINNWMLEQGWVLPQDLINNLQSQIASRADELVSGIGGAALSSVAVLSSFGTVLLIGTFATMFTLIGTDTLTRGVVGLAPTGRRKAAYVALRDCVVTARWWAFASTMTGLINGTLIGVGLWILGVPLAVPLGLMTFVLGYVPMIGSSIAGVIAVSIALFFGGLDLGLRALILVVIVLVTESNVITPLLMSRAMRFPPLVTLLLSTTGASVLGMVGLFLSVPVAGMIWSAFKGWRGQTREDGEHDLAAEGTGPEPDGRAAAAGASPPPPSDATAGENEQTT